VLARHKREESVMMRKVEEGALTDAAPGARNDPIGYPRRHPPLLQPCHSRSLSKAWPLVSHEGDYER